jgi:hypothetical protein
MTRQNHIPPGKSHFFRQFPGLFRNLLKDSLPRLVVHCASVAQPAERVLGKDEVASSNLA